jgi:hypothetical protein
MPVKWFSEKAKEQVEDPANPQAKQDVQNIEIKPELLEAAMKPHLEAQEQRYSAMMDEKLKAVNDFFTEHNRTRQEQQRRQQSEEDTPSDMDYINDPGNAIDKKLAPLIRSQQAANAMLMINETLGDMDYYKSDPEFKAKVLAKINSQPLQLRSNADIILNCYKLVAYDEREAIKEGKYKSILGAASTGGTGGHAGTRSESAEVTISDEEKVYAKKMGISEADWVKSKKTLEYV